MVWPIGVLDARKAGPLDILMKCFDHMKREAVGVCKTCSKGLCKECAIPLGFAITCKGDCESQAVSHQTYLDEVAATKYAVQRNRYLTPVIYGLIGSMLLFIDISMHGWRLSPMIIFGIGILVFSLYILFNSYQWGRDYESTDDK